MRFLAVNPPDAPAEENFITQQSDIPCFYTTRAFADGPGIEGFPAVVVIRDNRKELQLHFSFSIPAVQQPASMQRYPDHRPPDHVTDTHPSTRQRRAFAGRLSYLQRAP